MRYDSGIRAGRIWQDRCRRPEAAMGGGNQGERQEEGRCEKAAVSSTYGEGRRLHQDTAGIRNDWRLREGGKEVVHEGPNGVPQE